MAEILGIAAGVAGFVPLLVQITRDIDTLRGIRDSIDKAPEELASLENELAFVKHLLEEIVDKAPRSNDLTLQVCCQSCEQVVKDLEKLTKGVPISSQERKKQKVPKIITFRHWKSDVENLRKSIQGAKINLLLLITSRASSLLGEMMLVNQLHFTSLLDSTSQGNPHKGPSLPPPSALDSPKSSEADSDSVAGIQRPAFRRHWDCATRQCSCSCHHIARTTRRFWSLEYTPLRVFRQTCDNLSCNATKYGGTANFALSQFGIRWSVIIQFHILAAPGKFLFRPALGVERIVPYTSPAFEILWRCRLDRFDQNHITIGEARNGLIDLYRSDPTFKNHVNPSGESYIEWLLKIPWGNPSSRMEQYDLLELFMRDFGMTRGIQSARFLTSCAEWIGEGPHLELLEMLLNLGFDATLIDSPHALDWPDLSSPNWRSEKLTPDPFFIQYQRMLLKGNQGFAKMTPLHEAVLLGSLESVNKWILSSGKNERNFLGQTPMHFAVYNHSYLVVLIDAGHDPNAVDNYGITPLMYAAAENRQECLIELLEAGADPHLWDSKYQRTFMNYAAIRGHWNLILEFLCWVEAAAEEEAAQSWAKYATVQYHVVHPGYLEEREVSFQQLLAKCGSVNFTFNDQYEDAENNTLLYYARSVKNVEILFEHGFTLINHENSRGQHALLSLAMGWFEPTVVCKLLDAGAEIDLRDNSYHTALYYTLPKLQASNSDTRLVVSDIVRILLANGADVLCKDNCRCPCAPDGCLPSGLLDYTTCNPYFKVRTPIWSLECLSIIFEHRDISEAKAVLLSFIRKAKFDELGMTHVCCSHEGRYRVYLPPYKSSRSDEDIKEIIDEEIDFVKILEAEMAESSTKEYETLLDEWMVQIKVSLEKHSKEADEYSKHYPSYERENQSGPFVDYKNDRFIDSISCFCTNTNPIRAVTTNIAEYISWMESVYHIEDPSLMDRTNSSKEDWYFRRISWLHRLLDILEISPAQVADRLKSMWRKETETEDSARDMEGKIQHFLTSWEVQEK